MGLRSSGNLLGSTYSADQDSRLSLSDHVNRSAVKFAGDDDGVLDRAADEHVSSAPYRPQPSVEVYGTQGPLTCAVTQAVCNGPYEAPTLYALCTSVGEASLHRVAEGAENDARRVDWAV